MDVPKPAFGRRSSGLRNRNRARGRSTYARQQKGRSADYYGEWVNGHPIQPERIRSARQGA